MIRELKLTQQIFQLLFHDYDCLTPVNVEERLFMFFLNEEKAFFAISNELDVAYIALSISDPQHPLSFPSTIGFGHERKVQSRDRTRNGTKNISNGAK